MLFVVVYGRRSDAVKKAIIWNGAVRLAAVGAGPLLWKLVTSSEVVAYDDLGTEASRK